MVTTYTVKFDIASEPVEVPRGATLTEAAQKAGIEISQPCGGQGRCGQCAVQVISGKVRRRSTMRLSAADVERGYALACQTVVEGDVSVVVLPQEKIERRLTSDRTISAVTVPDGYNAEKSQTIRRIQITLPPPSMDDQTDDWSRLQTAIRSRSNVARITAPLHIIKKIGGVMREGNWEVTAILNSYAWDCPDCPAQLLDLIPGHVPGNTPLWGAAVDIGTTTVSVWLVDLLTGQVHAQAAEYNQQISRGEDVISRIVFASKGDGAAIMRDMVVETIDKLMGRVCRKVKTTSQSIVKVTITGNSTMMHLLLGIPATSIRLTPFITAINHVPTLSARDIGFDIHPDAIVDCLPGVASYVGADISAGILSSGVNTTDKITLFMDVGTNGEIVLGSKDWLVACAASAGPAFEGAGVLHGMRATKGAIEEVWINKDDFEPSYRVIGNANPRGLCGSGLISLLAEMFITGVVEKSGSVKINLDTPRTRQGDHGGEYVIAWGNVTKDGKEIVITNVDIDNLLRTKAAIYAGFAVLAESVGFPLEMVEQVIIGGSFGKYINVEKAIQIGLLPDMPWDNFQFLGNTSVKGAYLALIDREARDQIADIADSMTYIELSADNKFYDAFMSALFLPHTNLSLFPTVAAAMEKTGDKVPGASDQAFST